MPSDTRIFATTDESEAAVFVAFRKGRGDNVMLIKTTDEIFLTCGDTELQPWDSGAEKDWFLVVATKEDIVSPKPPRPS